MASYLARKSRAEPLHPGIILASSLDKRRVAGNAAAVAMGVTRQHFGKILRGEGPITPPMALRIAAYLGGSAELWLDLQRDRDLWEAARGMGDELKAIKKAPPLRDDA